MARWWAQKSTNNLEEESKCSKYDEIYNGFLGEKGQVKKFFSNGYPVNELQLILSSPSSNERMERQKGVLLYDFRSDEKSLEDLLLSNVMDFHEVVINKLFINKKLMAEALRELALRSINGASLYKDYTGAVIDTIDSYFYKSDEN